MVLPDTCGGSLLRKAHGCDAVAENLQLDVQTELAAELGVHLEGLRVGPARSHPDHRQHRADDVVFRSVQVLLEGAPRDPEGQAHVLRRVVPGEFVVARVEGGEQRAGLFLRELREEQRRREGPDGPLAPDGAVLGHEARLGESVEDGPRVRAVLEEKGDEGLAPLPSDRREDVRVVGGKRRDRFLLRLASAQEERNLLTGAVLIEDLPIGLPEFRRILDALGVPQEPKEEHGSQRIRVDREAGFPLRQVLERTGRASCERHLGRHGLAPRLSIRRRLISLEGNRFWLQVLHGPWMAVLAKRRWPGDGRSRGAFGWERSATRPVRKADAFRARTPRLGNGRMDKASVEGVEVRVPVAEQDESLFTAEALGFLAALHRRFDGGRRDLLRQRARRQEALDRGGTLDFLPETRAVREGSWSIAPVPADLQDRRVEITGPTDRKMMINALNSGASVFMADFEDANTPAWRNVVEGQLNLIRAVRRTLEFRGPEGKEYRLNPETATLVVRPRGWHLPEKHLRIDRKVASGSLVDFGLYFFHNAKELLARGTGPYFYLPKMESHLEARLWADVFRFAEERVGIPAGSVKPTALIETIPAASEMEEILHELREYAAGLHAGRLDYIFGMVKKFRARTEFVLPSRAQITMTVPFMRAYTNLLVRTCHRRRAHAIGGMAAFIPSRKDTATAEIARSQIWQWLRHAVRQHDGQPLTLLRVKEIEERELARIRESMGTEAFRTGKFEEARQLFDAITYADTFVEFLTLPAYERID